MSVDAYEPYDFANRRHIGPSPEEIGEMLAVLGVSSLDALIDETVPMDIRLDEALDFGMPLSERGALDRLRETANKNRVLTSLIGQGYHGTIMPPAIPVRRWKLISRRRNRVRLCHMRTSDNRGWRLTCR